MQRRLFVLGTVAAAGALAVGWGLLPARQRLTTRRPLPSAAGQVALNGWLVLGSDDSLSVVMPRSEMGQGTHTGLAMVLTDELDADWTRVRIVPAPIDPIYFNQAVALDGLPFHPDDDGAVRRAAAWMTAKLMREAGVMVTGGSSSLRDLWLPMRRAGASARTMLVTAAAQGWGVAADEVRVEAGVVSHRSGRQARFGALAAAAAQLPLAADPVLKSPAQFRLIGRPLPRLDAAAKGDGSAGFGIDVVQPGMLYATVAMCPTLGGTVASFDAAAALQLAGVRQVLAVPGHHGGTAGVAVVADTPWHALRAIGRVVVSWDERVPAAGFGSAEASDRLAGLLDEDGGPVHFSRGDVEAAFKTAARTTFAEYRAPWLAHATMEPQNCTVCFKDGRATVWAPTQVPDLARRAAALALGIAQDRVEVHVTLLGGGFGRRLDVDFVGQAAAIAAAAGGGAPVQTFWTREEDTRHDFYRPAAVARCRAGFDAQGRVVAWQTASAGQAIVPQVMARLFGLPSALVGLAPDKSTAEGASDQAYEWPNARVSHRAVELPVPIGYWRSVGHSHQAFFTESFVDEAAHAAGQDPLTFRTALLSRHPRQRNVLERAAALAGWGRPVPPARDGARAARGLALHDSFGSVVAQVAEVSLAADGTIRVHRVACAIDCGTPVNPGLVRQQIEGAIVFGLSAALHGRIDIERGRVRQSNFHDCEMLRIADCPAIEVEIVASAAPPQGVGEAGTPPVAPAVANAIFALTGKRLRTLPLRID